MTPSTKKPKPIKKPVASPLREGKLRLFLSILQSAGGETSGNDTTWNWINYFCDDAEPLDTFNQASKQGFTRVTHDSDSDNSDVYLTEAGRKYLTEPSDQSVKKPDDSFGDYGVKINGSQVISRTGSR